MFTQGADAVERARAFRDKRIATIDVRRTARLLAQQGRAILHLIPLAGVVDHYQLDVGSLRNRWVDIRLLDGYAADYRFNLDGLLVEGPGRDNRLFEYVQVFRSGAIESVQAGLQNRDNGPMVIWGNSLEARIGRAVPGYMGLLQALGAPPPFAAMLTLDNLSSTIIRVGLPDPTRPEPVQYEQVAVLPEALIEDYGSEADYIRALRPIFDAIWNMAGKARAASYDGSGNWNPK
jgi:hypothetical protein